MAQGIHEIRSIWNRYETGVDEPCIYEGPGRSALDRFCYPGTVESNPVWNCMAPGWLRAHVNTAH